MRKFLAAATIFIALAAILTLLNGCSTGNGDITETTNNETITQEKSAAVEETTEQLEITLIADRRREAGKVTVWTDEESLYVKYQTTDDRQLQRTYLAVGKTLDEIPQNKKGNPLINKFPYKTVHRPSVQEYTCTIALNEAGLTAGDTVYVAAYALIRRRRRLESAWANGENFPGRIWATYFTYQIPEATTTPDTIEVGDFKTYSQEEWGGAVADESPGEYMETNFDAAFPNGLTVGNTDGFTAQFTSMVAVESFLPQFGMTYVFVSNYVDPPATTGGTLAGRAVALTLNIQFDLYDENFGAGSYNLKDLVVADEESPFAGMTVEQVLTEANLVLAGHESSYAAADIEECLMQINSNFTGGTVVGEFLQLPQ